MLVDRVSPSQQLPVDVADMPMAGRSQHFEPQSKSSTRCGRIMTGPLPRPTPDCDSMIVTENQSNMYSVSEGGLERGTGLAPAVTLEAATVR